MKSTLILSVLLADEILALVKAKGSLQASASSCMKGHCGIRIPMELWVGLSSGLRVLTRSKMRVTGPGSRSLSSSSLTQTFPHL